MDWVTNNAAVAKKLKAIDSRYERDREIAKHFALSDKVEAFRAAKHRRDAARAQLLTTTTLD